MSREEFEDERGRLRIIIELARHPASNGEVGAGGDPLVRASLTLEAASGLVVDGLLQQKRPGTIEADSIDEIPTGNPAKSGAGSIPIGGGDEAAAQKVRGGLRGVEHGTESVRRSP
jgi:hypothetical protein